MKILFLGLTLLLSTSAFSMKKGQGLCIKTVLDNKLSTSIYSAKSDCDGVSEGQAICMKAVLDNKLNSSSYSAKTNCD